MSIENENEYRTSAEIDAAEKGALCIGEVMTPREWLQHGDLDHIEQAFEECGYTLKEILAGYRNIMSDETIPIPSRANHLWASMDNMLDDAKEWRDEQED